MNSIIRQSCYCSPKFFKYTFLRLHFQFSSLSCYSFNSAKFYNCLDHKLSKINLKPFFCHSFCSHFIYFHSFYLRKIVLKLLRFEFHFPGIISQRSHCRLYSSILAFHVFHDSYRYFL